MADIDWMRHAARLIRRSEIEKHDPTLAVSAYAVLAEAQAIHRLARAIENLQSPPSSRDQAERIVARLDRERVERDTTGIVAPQCSAIISCFDLPGHPTVKCRLPAGHGGMAVRHQGIRPDGEIARWEDHPDEPKASPTA